MQENEEMGKQIDEAQFLLDEQDDRIEEMEKMIVNLSNEIESKNALEKKLNERLVKAELQK